MTNRTPVLLACACVDIFWLAAMFDIAVVQHMLAGWNGAMSQFVRHVMCIANAPTPAQLSVAGATSQRFRPEPASLRFVDVGP